VCAGSTLRIYIESRDIYLAYRIARHALIYWERVEPGVIIRTYNACVDASRI
jgi:hypothetical protein